jgi:hypothetical protein
MREITEETFMSVNDFISGLNGDQIIDFFTRLQEKQPVIHSYILMNFRSEASDKSRMHANFIFTHLIRSYEYEYGEFPMIDVDTVKNFQEEKNKYLTLELKRNSRSKVINGLRREGGQRELLKFLDLFIEGDKETPSDFLPEEMWNMKVAFYLTVILLNEEMEKLQ